MPFTFWMTGPLQVYKEELGFCKENNWYWIWVVFFVRLVLLLLVLSCGFLGTLKWRHSSLILKPFILQVAWPFLCLQLHKFLLSSSSTISIPYQNSKHVLLLFLELQSVECCYCLILISGIMLFFILIRSNAFLHHSNRFIYSKVGFYSVHWVYLIFQSVFLFLLCSWVSWESWS